MPLNVMQIEHWNEGATMPLVVPVLVLPNTPEEIADDNIRRNSLLPIPWFQRSEPHDGVAVIVGGGPSINDFADEIAWMQEIGATIIALNGAAAWLVNRGIYPDVQVILDAKEETSALVEVSVPERLYFSQVHPETARYATTLCHLNNAGIEDLFPPERVAAGGYTLVGGGVSVGITAMVLAWCMGYRELHLFGYDSSGLGGKGHAYPQQMNSVIPNIDVTWAGKTYTAAMPMKVQAETFPRIARQLQDEGCGIHVWGDGLLQAMWREPPGTEREKYQKLWADPRYRHYSPGEETVGAFLKVAKPEPGARVIDFGCGTGLASLELEAADLHPILSDFTDNSREATVAHLPFIEHDLNKPFPIRAPYGFCTDVMEHIPSDEVETVLRNMVEATDHLFLRISTVPDTFSKFADCGKLHLSVYPHEWWREKLEAIANIEWQHDYEAASCFYVTRKHA